jgi:hypothetical protein
MKKHYIFAILILFFLQLSFTNTTTAQLTWSYTYTGNNALVLVPDTVVLLLNNTPLEPGDYIGVFFYDDSSILQCGGYHEYNGAVLAITVWGNDLTNSVKDGFDTNEIYNFKIWDSSADAEFDADPTYWINSTFNSGFYTINGYSCIKTLMSNSYLSADMTAVSCYGLSDGAIDLTIFFGQAPYTIAWSTGASTEDIAGIPAGSYSVTVTDALSVVETLSMSVTEPNELVSNILVNEANAFQCEAYAEAYGAGGSTPYIYLWNDPNVQATALAEHLCPGTYEVQVSDANGCTTISSALIQQNSGNVTDSAFTLIDSCLVNSILDTAYISNLFYSATVMMIEWTLISTSNDTAVFMAPYPTITSPGVFYVGLTINCPTKNAVTIELVQIIEITPQLLGSAEQIPIESNFEVYPNPVQSLLNIEIPSFVTGTIEVQLFNAIGSLLIDQVIVKNEYAQRLTMETGELDNGIYILRINKSNEQLFVKKIIK